MRKMEVLVYSSFFKGGRRKSGAFALTSVAVGVVAVGAALLLSTSVRTASGAAASQRPTLLRRLLAPSLTNPCAQRKRFYIYYATAAFASPFYTPIKTGAENGARDFCMRMTWTQSPSRYSLADTLTRMKAGIAARPDVLVVSMVNPQAEDATVRQAIKAGIQVIDINAQDRRPVFQQPPYLTFIGVTSDYNTGAAAARAVLAVKKPVLALVANPEPGTTALLDRVRGWQQAMSAAGAQVATVDVSKHPTQALKSYLVAHPNVDALYTLVPGSRGSGTARQVIAGLKRGGTIALVGTDYDSSDLQAISKGTQLAAITQEQYLQGYLPAVVTRTYFVRGQVPAFISTGPRVVNKGNIASVIALQAKGLR